MLDLRSADLSFVLTAVCKNKQIVVGNITAREAVLKLFDREFCLISSGGKERGLRLDAPT